MVSLKSAAVSGIKWTAVSNFGRRILSLTTNIILARLLLPSDFGLVAMAAVVLGLLELFRDFGTGSAIIQRRELSQELLSSVFWMNAALGVGVMLLLIVGAPLIGILYQEPRIIAVLQVLSISFLILALSIVHSSLMERELAFESLAKIEIASALLSSLTAVGLAFSGAGVWSLVWRGIAGNVLSTIWFWLVSPWRPSMLFRWKELKPVMGYSLNLTGANLLNFFTRNIDNLLIGRFLGAEQLGYYNLAYQLMLYPLQSISAVMGRVMFPLYVQYQDDSGQFRRVYLLVAGAIALVTFPMMFGLMAVREPLVITLVGPRWEPVILLLAVLAPLGAVQSIGTTVGSIYQAKGRTDIMLYWVLFALIFITTAIVVGLQWGIVGVAACYAIMSMFLLYPQFSIPFRLIDLPVLSLLKVMRLPFICTIIMFLIVELLGIAIRSEFSSSTQLFILILVGVISYSVSLWLIDRSHVLNIIKVVRGK